VQYSDMDNPEGVWYTIVSSREEDTAMMLMTIGTIAILPLMGYTLWKALHPTEEPEVRWEAGHYMDY